MSVDFDVSKMKMQLAVALLIKEEDKVIDIGEQKCVLISWDDIVAT